MTTLPLIGFDTETQRICQSEPLPKIICLSMHQPDHGSAVFDNSDWDNLRKTCLTLLTEFRHCRLIGQSVSYDLGVMAANFPDLLPAIWEALDDGRISSIDIRERLLNLATTGDLKFMNNPDGSKSPIKYSMEALASHYINLDLSEAKNDPTSFRTNFDIFDGISVKEWPQEAVEYVVKDAEHPVRIYQFQEERRQTLIRERGIDPFGSDNTVENFRTFVDFCLRLMSARGVATDRARVAEVEAMLEKELAPEKLQLLFSTGIIRHAEPPRPYKNGAKQHVAGCPDAKKSTCNCPPKMAEGTEESLNRKVLEEWVLTWAKELNTVPCGACGDTGTIPAKDMPKVFIGCTDCSASGRISKPDALIKLAYTDPTETCPKGNLSITDDFLAAHEGYLDPVLRQYRHRAKLQKLVTTEIPRMKLNGEVQDVVFPQFDPIKETGRVSSFASKPTAAKPQESAQFNCQNVDPRVRGCYVARKGRLLWSCDYSQMELASLAQRCHDLFGYSVLRDRINAGQDVHAFTGAQLAYAKDEEFRKMAIVLFGTPTPENNYELLVELRKDVKNPEHVLKGDHWRKFAKPVNLGFPGGLGARTFVTYAASEQYQVQVTEEEAYEFREIWKATYPEMADYFKYINTQCIDPFNKGWDKDEEQEYSKYAYRSPFGMYRAGCDYCSCSNGLGLQTHSADGALLALINVTRACYLPNAHAILSPNTALWPSEQPVTPLMFVHDELIGEIDDGDAQMRHDRCRAIKKIMEESMRAVTPDVTPRANICLMRRWDKNAKAIFKDGLLDVWEPEA